jgi:hypothetical protein
MSDDGTVGKRERPANQFCHPPSLFQVVVVIRALIAFAIISVFPDRAQD